MLVLKLQIGTDVARALVDTGSSLTWVSRCLAGCCRRSGAPVRLDLMDGSCIWTEGCVTLYNVLLENRHVDRIEAHVLPMPPAGVDVVLGLDVIMRLGLNIGARGESAMLTITEHVAASSQIGTNVEHLEEVDFKASFSKGKWTVAWKWLSGPPSLSPVAPVYAIKP